MLRGGGGGAPCATAQVLVAAWYGRLRQIFASERILPSASGRYGNPLGRGWIIGCLLCRGSCAYNTDLTTAVQPKVPRLDSDAVAIRVSAW